MNWLLLPMLIGAGVVGVALHEATHAIVWTLGGRRVRFNVSKMAVVTDVQRIRLRDRVAALSPLMLGAAVTPWIIGTGRLSPLVGVALLFYAVGGVWMVGGGLGSDLEVAFT